MEIHKFRIYLGNKNIGEIETLSDSRRLAAQEFLTMIDKNIGGFVGVGLRRVLRCEPGLLIAEEAGS